MIRAQTIGIVRVSGFKTMTDAQAQSLAWDGSAFWMGSKETKRVYRLDLYNEAALRCLEVGAENRRRFLIDS